MAMLVSDEIDFKANVLDAIHLDKGCNAPSWQALEDVGH